MRFDNELKDLEDIRRKAELWGYGNCIQYLKYAWAKSLLKDGISREVAAKGALMDTDEAKAFVKGRKILYEDVVFDMRM